MSEALRQLDEVKWKREHEAYGSWIGITCIALGLALPSLGGKASSVKQDPCFSPRLSAHWLVTWRSIAPSLLARQSFSILRASID